MGRATVFYLIRPGVICPRLIGQRKAVNGQSSRKVGYWTALQQSVIGRAIVSTNLDKRRQFKMKSAL
jgi:hypothetical protein